MADACIIIITRNRKETAKRAIRSALALAGDIEVVVIDDGSTDGTDAAVRAEFPGVIVARSEQQLGYIVQRNRAVEMSSAPFVFSLDDDAEFVDPQTAMATLRVFECARVGAVAIPFINCMKDGRQTRVVPPAPDDSRLWVSNTFIGTAFAIRRGTFLKLNGFQGLLFHWGEESEFSQRLLGAGYVVAIAARGMIHHYPEGTGKYVRQTNRFIFRNGLLTIWLNAPAVLLPLLLSGKAAKYLLIDGLRHPANLPTVLEGCLMAIKAMVSTWRQRKPISLRAYWLWLRLRRERAVDFAGIADELPPLQI